MTNYYRRLFMLFVLVLLLAGGLSRALEPNEPDEAKPVAKAAVIVCKDMIDDGLFESIKRRTDHALENGCNYLIYEISTYGGLLKSADDISKYLIQNVAKRAHTVAYVTTEAISAGAMISVSCQDIIMRKSTTIGDCAPIVMGGTLEGVEREKAESFTRVAFRRAAEANGYPPALLKAMVTMQTKVYRLKDLATGEFKFFEDDMLPNDPNKYDLENKQLIVPDDELLTLTADQALDYGVARAVVDDLDEALGFLAQRDGVRFEGSATVFDTNWSEELVRWLGSPAVLSVLVMLALLGVYIELSSPGIGLPGLVAVLSIATIIGSKYLIGMANWVEILVFVIGVLLLLIEIFVLPGFGIAGVLGIVCVFGGIFGMLIKNPPNQAPWPRTTLDWALLQQGFIGMAAGFAGFVVLAWAFTKYVPKTRLFSGLVLMPKPADEMALRLVSMTRPGGSGGDKPGLSIGDVGVVVSSLRPSGKASFGEAIVDVVALGDFLAKGAKVKIIEMHGNRVVVRSVDG